MFQQEIEIEEEIEEKQKYLESLQLEEIEYALHRGYIQEHEAIDLIELNNH